MEEEEVRKQLAVVVPVIMVIGIIVAFAVANGGFARGSLEESIKSPPKQLTPIVVPNIVKPVRYPLTI